MPNVSTRSIVMQSPNAVVVSCSGNILVFRSRRSAASVMPVAGRRPDPLRSSTRLERRKRQRRSAPLVSSEAHGKAPLGGRVGLAARRSAPRVPPRRTRRRCVFRRGKKAEKRRAREVRRRPAVVGAEGASAVDLRVAMAKGREISPRRRPLVAVAVAEVAAAVGDRAPRVRSSGGLADLSGKPRCRNFTR